ncbi:MAG: extensin family protein [Phyllobacterium sp.]|uniref:extensin-like domain-containing protein n=1 Tax=Phyllobacterium sp. TaxID=1871046 RepID=UPI0030F302A7
MTLFSQPARRSIFLLSFTTLIASTMIFASLGDADARRRRPAHAAAMQPPLPSVPPLPEPNPRAAQATEAPKPEEKPKDEIQKADPETPVPSQKPAAGDTKQEPSAKPEVKPAEQLGPNPLPKSDQAGKSEANGDHEESVEKVDPSVSPDRVYQNACPALMNGEVQGALIAPLSEGMCGERSPLKITTIGKDNPVKLAAAITTNCAMAGSLATWVVEIQKEAQKDFGADIESITTGSDYQCRKVNNGHKGRVSEHAFANAVDIVAFKFKNGKGTELGSGWKGAPEEQTFWRALHKASCDRFMTVIGPDGDAAHQGNLHLDLGCHGKKCEARICQ